MPEGSDLAEKQMARVAQEAEEERNLPPTLFQ